MRIERAIDTDADTSHLGEYGDRPGPCAIDRKMRGDAGQHEYRYWNPSENHVPVGNPENWARVTDREVCKAIAANLPRCSVDPCVAIGWPARYDRARAIAWLDNEYIEQDYRRMEALARGDWCYFGIVAKAEVRLTTDVLQTIRSGGLWGVESDSRDEYLGSVEREELADLRRQLVAIGCTNRQIDHAFKTVERCDK